MKLTLILIYKDMKKLLFVCLGNICRSPTAQAVFDWKLGEAGLQMDTDSAGTSGYHAGNPPDPRSQEIGRGWGLDMSDQRARQVVDEDFERFDVIYAMDRSNLQALRERCPAVHRDKVRLIMELAPDYGLEEVPDPYYGGEDGFRQVVDMLVAAAERFVEEHSA